MPKAPASPPPQPPTSPAPPEAASPEETLPWLEEMPPKKIVAELDRYIVGQEAAKKAVAIAVRNRWRRAQAPEEIRDEIMPNNIIMIGPTGVGKRRSRAGWRGSRAHRSSKSRRRSSPKSGTSAVTSSP